MTVYQINKGVNASMEFRGLKAQFIWYLGGGLLTLLILFAILYICGINPYVCVAVILVAGVCLFLYVYKLNNKYGEHGMMRTKAKKYLPRVLRCRTRERFIKPKKALA